MPWFIKDGRADLIDAFNIPLDEYPARCEDQMAEWGAMRAALTSSDPTAPDRYEAGRGGGDSQGHGTPPRRCSRERTPELAESTRQEVIARRKSRGSLWKATHSGEYGSLIIHSMETGQPRVIYGNVQNNGIISNLPAGCCVEVPCLIDRNGVQPTRSAPCRPSSPP